MRPTHRTSCGRLLKDGSKSGVERAIFSHQLSASGGSDSTAEMVSFVLSSIVLVVLKRETEDALEHDGQNDKLVFLIWLPSEKNVLLFRNTL